MSVMVELPHDQGQALLNFLRVTLDMEEIDYCEMHNDQHARVTWGPIDPRTPEGT